MTLRGMKKFAVAGLLGVLLWPWAAHAQTSFSIESVGTQIGLGTADLKQAIINILTLVLGFVPIVCLIMIMLGGFLWLTSAGNEERIDRAKKTISGAVVGLVLVMLAWAVVIFAAHTTANVTQ